MTVQIQLSVASILPIQREEENKIIEQPKWVDDAFKLVDELWNHEDAHIFYHPVRPEDLYEQDYFEIIKNPMDFGTILKKLYAGQYKSYQSVVKDIDLVFSNCLEYNGRKSEIGEMCLRVKKRYNELKVILKQKPNVQQQRTSPRKPSAQKLNATPKKVQTPKKQESPKKEELKSICRTPTNDVVIKRQSPQKGNFSIKSISCGKKCDISQTEYNKIESQQGWICSNRCISQVNLSRPRAMHMSSSGSGCKRKEKEERKRALADVKGFESYIDS